MTDLVIRDLDPAVKAQLQDRAAQHGWSIEDEVRAALSALLSERPGSGPHLEGLGTRIARRFALIGLRPGEELERPDQTWTPPAFGP